MAAGCRRSCRSAPRPPPRPPPPRCRCRRRRARAAGAAARRRGRVVPFGGVARTHTHARHEPKDERGAPRAQPHTRAHEPNTQRCVTTMTSPSASPSPPSPTLLPSPHSPSLPPPPDHHHHRRRVYALPPPSPRFRRHHQHSLCISSILEYTLRRCRQSTSRKRWGMAAVTLRGSERRSVR